MDFMSLNQLNALADLCKHPDENSDSDNDDDMKPGATLAKMGPSDIGPKSSTSKVTVKAGPKPKEKSKDIWDTDEVGDGAEYEEIHDPRPSPKYEFKYSQDVSSADMFLGMNNKTNATASCENMKVEIQLPNTRGADIKLDVKDKFLDCRTPKYKLGLHLPHPVDPKSGNAKWIADKCVLEVTLKMVREYDFMNF